ncbi:MAG TPA: beta-ketoacyl synthase N-terminal-like domain-containing protein, partial [Desulfuromonadales bacterium]|nr:beta-ketoacyl synthase N-terminal-like domain-containing protein [Desulfuromonadales bacterium]
MTNHSKPETGSTQPETSPIAVIGLGCLFPQANDVGSFWTNIKSGSDAITEVPETHWKTADYFNEDPKAPDQVYAKRGGFLSPVDFNPMQYGILPNAVEATDTSQLLGMVAVEQALQDAGYDRDREFDREKVSVILGVTGALELVIPLGARLGHPRWRQALKDAGIEDEVAEDVISRIADSYVPWQENSFPGLLGNVVAGRISRHFDFGGTNCVVDAACGSSLSALNLAALELSAGKADMVISGGIDTFNDIFMYTCFSKTPALSPSGHARPFDAGADGTTLGEGLGVVILKRLADAERDGDKIYAVIRGIGASSDGRGAAIYEPNAAGQEKAVRRAYAQADISPETIELIEAHGTGTKVGDAIEIKGLRSVFGEADTPRCAIGSIKSQIGHTKAAAGSAGMIKACLALYHKTLPPTIKVERPSPAVTDGRSPFYVNTRTRPWVGSAAHPRRAGISALGFGGSNYHCLLEEYRPEKPLRDWQGDIQIALFSAGDEDGLAKTVENFETGSGWQQLRRQAAQSRRQFDVSQPYRLGLVVEREKTDRTAQRRNALTLLEKNRGQQQWSSPDGVFFAAGESGPSAVLFPGQGAQYPGMLQDLGIQFPAFLAAFEAADRAFAANAGPGAGRLAELVYPPPRFDQQQAAEDEARLRATATAQPALGAVSLGALDVLSDFGFRPTAFAGHSYGELTALCAAGCFGRETLHMLSRLRGELMAAGEGDRGSMLAVSAPLADIETLLAEGALDLVLANRNMPEQGVLSGSSEEIRKAAAFFEGKGVRCKPLSVSAAFHSRLVADAARPFAAKLQEVDFSAPAVAVYANSSGRRYPDEPAQARDLLAGQLASPVDFITEIESLYQAGIRTFVEVGPGARLTGMVKAILKGRDHQALAIDASSGQRAGLHDLARALTQLAVGGQALDLTVWDENIDAEALPEPAKKPGMTIPVGGANHFVAPARRPPAAPRPMAKDTNTNSVQQAESPTPKAPASPSASPAMSPATPPLAPPPAADGSLQEALRISQQSLQALQSLQEQTAQLHKKFLEGQDSAARSFLELIQQQQTLLRGEQPVSTAAEAGKQTPPAFAEQPPAAVKPAAEPAKTSSPAAQDAQAAPSAPAAASGRAGEVLLEVVAEKTGYPVEMLELEMALDADLGIDSIKRVEILSALQERLPEAPAVRPEDLGGLQTLGQI